DAAWPLNPLAEAGRMLAALRSTFLATVARGSSDHAATLLNYAIQIGTGTPVMSVGPSVASVHGARLRAQGAAAVALSQSGASTDLAEALAMLTEGGARPMVLTNTPDSALGALGRPTLDILAGPERAVAATKSFVNTALAGLWVLAHWSGDQALRRGLETMPEALEAALAASRGTLAGVLATSPDIVCCARGPAYGVAHEAALKLQEVLGHAAAAYSGAEILHGPIGRMQDGVPVIAFGTADDPGMAQARARLARVVSMTDTVPTRQDHPALVALPQIAAFYAAVEETAQALGRDPDAPPHLRKETVTR
ncbi:MAG: SIS domain-containing protein, partial [Shimia sp.]